MGYQGSTLSAMPDQTRPMLKEWQKLLKAMADLTGMHRTAYFECHLVLASPEGIKKSVTGTCEGTILTEERGRDGFGYDSIFVKSEYDKTFAELDETTKNRVSHRRKAFEKISPSLQTLMQG